MRLGVPNLSEVERTVGGGGVVVIYYADEGDYRCRWFSELDFFDMPWPADGCCDGAIGPDCCSATFGDEWLAGEPVEVTEQHVKDWYVPRFLDAMHVTREAKDEPPHSGYEVYWRGCLVHQTVL